MFPVIFLQLFPVRPAPQHIAVYQILIQKGKHVRKNPLVIKLIATVHEDHILSAAQISPLVHGVVQTAVRLKYGPYLWVVLILTNQFCGTVPGQAVDDQILHIFTCLPQYRLYRFHNGISRIIAHGNHRNFYFPHIHNQLFQESVSSKLIRFSSITMGL